MSKTEQNITIPLQRCLLLIFSVIFSEFLIMGISLGTLPTYVHGTLGYNNIIVGAVIGLQYLATLLTRHLAGQSADAKGGKVTVTTGLALSAISGAFCLLSLWFKTYGLGSLLLLCAGRVSIILLSQLMF